MRKKFNCPKHVFKSSNLRKVSLRLKSLKVEARCPGYSTQLYEPSVYDTGVVVSDR